MIIIYLHGFRSTANSGKTSTLREMFPQHQVIGLNYSPHNPRLAENQLSQLMASIELNKGIAKDILVIGTSLGGFWARWLAHRFKLKALMINPSLHPDKTLEAGSYQLFDQNSTIIEVGKKDLEAFAGYKVSGEQIRLIKATVWLALNDEVLNAAAALEELDGDVELVTFESGSHRFTQFASMKKEIELILAR